MWGNTKDINQVNGKLESPLPLNRIAVLSTLFMRNPFTTTLILNTMDKSRLFLRHLCFLHLYLFQCAGRCWNRSTFCAPTFERFVIWISSNKWGVRPKREWCENPKNAMKIYLLNELITSVDTNNIFILVNIYSFRWNNFSWLWQTQYYQQLCNNCVFFKMKVP